MAVITRTVALALDGLVAVHAARAVHTALGAVPGIVSAEVSLAGARVDVAGPFDEEQFAGAVRAALEPIGIGLRALTVESQRVLPLA